MSQSEKRRSDHHVEGPTTFKERHGGLLFAAGMIVLLALLILLNGAC